MEVGRDGLHGDRLLRVDEPAGKVTARTRPKLLGLAPTLAADGEVRIDGEHWRGEPVRRRVERAAPGGTLVETSSGPRFDLAPVHMVADGTVSALGIDRRRVRPNLLVAGLGPCEEQSWIGSTLRIGSAVLAVTVPCERCVITTIHPDSLAMDPSVLRRINDELDGRLGVYCEVVQPGRITRGDPVEVGTA